jgi:hypothetical protein
MPVMPTAGPPPQDRDQARRFLADLLGELRIGVRSLSLRPHRGCSRVTLDCARCGGPSRIGLELAGDTFAVASRNPALRDALLIELDEHLSDCERCRGATV